MTKSKLDDKLEDRASIKFTNYAINKFQYDFKPGSKSKSGAKNFQTQDLKD